MAKLFDGVSSFEGLVGVAMTLAFVILAMPYVRKAASTLASGDPVVQALKDLIGVMRDNTEANREQVEQFTANNKLFEGVIQNTKTIQEDISAIRSDVHDELVRQQGEREAKR